MWPLILAGAGLGLGALKGEEQRKQAAAMNKAAAMQTRWAPLTGTKPGQMTAPGSSMVPMLQGALAGGMLGQAVQKSLPADKKDTKTGTQASTAPTAPDPQPNLWGSTVYQDYGAQQSRAYNPYGR